MENLESKGVLGNFKLSESVISTIIATAATEVPGVAGMASFEPNFKNISTIKNILNRDITQKSTNIKFSEGALSVDLCVKVFFGSNLKEVAHKVQENVNGQWKDLNYVSDRLMWDAIGYRLNENNQLTQKLDIKYYYGPLKNGTYRIVKPVGLFSNEFEIK